MSNKELFFKVSAKLSGKEVNVVKAEAPDYISTKRREAKERLLEAQLIGNPDTRCNTGAVKVPEGFAIMRLEGEKNKLEKSIFYFVKYTGEFSDVSNRAEVLRWAKANAEYHDE